MLDCECQARISLLSCGYARIHNAAAGIRDGEMSKPFSTERLSSTEPLSRTERLSLSNNCLHVEVLPAYGAKIASLRVLPEQEELLQMPLRPYASRTRTMAFEDGDASGIDECIPTVSGCTVATDRGDLTLPDHGDFWRVPFRHWRDGDELVLEADGFSLPLRFQKRLGLDGTRLRISYRLENTGAEAVPYLWSAHPGFAVDAGDRIHLPSTIGEVAVWYSAGSRLGGPGTVHAWPRTLTPEGRPLDLSVAGEPDAGAGDKLFAVDVTEGWAALERRRLQRRVEVRFDPVAMPHLGLWLAYGGWPAGRVERQHCIALEPCTAPADSLATAIERGYARTLAAGGVAEWHIEIHVVPA